MENDKNIIQWERHTEADIMFRFTQTGPQKLSYGDKIIIRSGEVAIFTSDGKLTGGLETGEYEINNANLPILSEIEIYNKEKTFDGNIYFIDVNPSKGHIWGALTPVSITDKNVNDVSVGVIGKYDYQIANYKLFAKRIAPKFDTFSRTDLDKYIKPRILTEFINAANELHVSIFDIEQYYTAIASIMGEKLHEIFSELGITIENIVIDEVQLPTLLRNPLNKRKYDELTSESFSKIDFDPSLGLNNGECYIEMNKLKVNSKEENLVIANDETKPIDTIAAPVVENLDKSIQDNLKETEANDSFDEFKLTDDSQTDSYNSEFRLNEEITDKNTYELLNDSEKVQETISSVNSFVLNDKTETINKSEMEYNHNSSLKYEQFDLEVEKQDTIRRYKERINDDSVPAEDVRKGNESLLSLEIQLEESVDNKEFKLQDPTAKKMEVSEDMSTSSVKFESTLSLDDINHNVDTKELEENFSFSLDLNPIDEKYDSQVDNSVENPVESGRKFENDTNNDEKIENRSRLNENFVSMSLEPVEDDVVFQNLNSVHDEFTLSPDTNTVENSNTLEIVDDKLSHSQEKIVESVKIDDFTLSLDPLLEDNSEIEFDVRITDEDIKSIPTYEDEVPLSFEVQNDEQIKFEEFSKIKKDLDYELKDFSKLKSSENSKEDGYKFSEIDSFDDYSSGKQDNDYEIDENLYSIEPPESEIHAGNTVRDLINRKKDFNFFELDEDEQTEDFSAEINQPLVDNTEDASGFNNYSDDPYLNLVAERQKNNSSKLLDASRTSAFIVRRKREEESRSTLNKDNTDERKGKISKSESLTNGAYSPGVRAYEYDFSSKPGMTKADQRKILREQLLIKLGDSSSTISVFIHTNNRVESRNEPSFSKSTSKTTTKMCPHCAALIAETSKYCRFCGKDTKIVKKICPSCNNHVSDSANFCSICGTRV